MKHQNMIQTVEWSMSLKYVVACCGVKPGTWSRKDPSLHVPKYKPDCTMQAANGKSASQQHALVCKYLFMLRL